MNKVSRILRGSRLVVLLGLLLLMACESGARPSTTRTQRDEDREHDPRTVVEKANLQRSDLDDEWKVVKWDFVSRSKLRTPACSDHPTPSVEQAGSVHEFSYRLNRQGLEEGHLQAIMFIHDSPDAAAATQAVLGSPDYEPCTIRIAQSDMAAKGIDEVVETYVAPIDWSPPPSMTGSARQVRIFHRSGPAEDDVAVYYQDEFRLQSGRLRARVSIGRLRLPFDSAFERCVMAALAERMTALPEGRTADAQPVLRESETCRPAPWPTR